MTADDEVAVEIRQPAIVTSENEALSGIEIFAIITAILWTILTLPISIFCLFFVCKEYERAVLFRLGRLKAGGVQGPGIFFVLPCVEDIKRVDLRTVTLDVPPQEVLSKDSVSISVDAVVFYRISDPLKAVIQVEDYAKSTSLLASTTLRNVLGTRNLTEILSEREAIAHTMQIMIDDATDPWGIEVERVEIKDVSLPKSLQRAMAAEAEASREARAHLISAEGEMKASIALKEASDVITESPAALQLRYLQTLNTVSAENNQTIIFPLPLELMKKLLGK